MDEATAGPSAYRLLMWAEAETRPYTEKIGKMPHYITIDRYPPGIPLLDGEVGALALTDFSGNVIDVLRRIIK
jgi:hypothetical protein